MIVNGIIRLGQDSQLKFTQSGTALLSFSGAYNTGYGQNKETHWLKCAMFGKQAEALQQYLVKSSRVFINGKDLKVATYQKQDGSTGVSLECIVNEIDFAGGSQQQGQSQQQANNFQQPQVQPQQQGQYVQNGQPMNPQQYKQAQAQGQQPQQGFTPAPNSFYDDDVPFSMKATSPELFLLV